MTRNAVEDAAALPSAGRRRREGDDGLRLGPACQWLKGGERRPGAELGRLGRAGPRKRRGREAAGLGWWQPRWGRGQAACAGRGKEGEAGRAWAG